MTRSVAFITMGCAKNEFDSAHMADLLAEACYAIVDDPGAADVVIVNTCSFIQAATEESIDAILEAAGYENIVSGSARLIVAGCMPARYRADLADELPEVSRFVPCADEEGIVAVVDGLFPDKRADTGATEGLAQGGLRDGVHAYVKISDGCDRFCSYCAIPFIRGRYRSFPFDEIERSVGREIEAGAREIVLIAQDTGRWGEDLDEPSTLAQLLSRLASAYPSTWFRVMYIQPEGVTDELIKAVAAHANVCPYFDIPFQHCDPAVLARMNRHGSAREYLDLIERIRRLIPDATLRTTLIAGFPGESDDQFDQLCDFVEAIEFDYVGVFPYSREEGTRAYGLDGQVDEEEKRYRAQALRDKADVVSAGVIAARIGSVRDVVVCGVEEDGQVYGRAMCQAPEVDGVTYVTEGSPGDVLRVRIGDTLMYEMEGEAI